MSDELLDKKENERRSLLGLAIAVALMTVVSLPFNSLLAIALGDPIAGGNCLQGLTGGIYRYIFIPQRVLLFTTPLSAIALSLGVAIWGGRWSSFFCPIRTTLLSLGGFCLAHLAFAVVVLAACE
jgi:hypothetical protein